MGASDALEHAASSEGAPTPAPDTPAAGEPVLSGAAGSTRGGSTQGGSTQGGSTQGGSTQGGSTQGGSSEGEPPLAPKTAPAAEPVASGDGPVAPPQRAAKPLQRIFNEVAKFGVVGAVAYVVDVGLFNLFRFGFGVGPLTSKTISTVVAVTVAYYGNRNWTWRDRTRNGFRREYLLFFLVNGAGLAIQLAVLGFTVYALGMDGQLAENISGNVIGVGLGTLFRFWAYRTWVFPTISHDPQAPAADDALEATTTTPY